MPGQGWCAIVNRTLNYSIRRYRPQDEGAVLQLLGLSLSSATSRWETPALWRWKHQQNPFGPSYTLVAESDDGEIVGVRALMRWKFAAPSGPIDAVRPVDTATHPSFRRFGIFSGVTSQAMAELQAQGVPLVFNTPNMASLPGYLKMGWSSIGTVRPLIKVVNPAKVISKLAMARARRGIDSLPDGYQVEATLPSMEDLLAQPGLDSLLQQDAALDRYQLGTDKSIDYLRWRYRDHVSLGYHALWEESAAQITACLILRPYRVRELRGLVIAELLLAAPDVGLASSLINKAVKAHSADVLTAYFSPRSFKRQALHRNGFRQDLRKKVNVVMRSLNPVPGLDTGKIQTWGLSMGDLEFL